MKLINPSWEIIKQNPGLEGIYEQIELAGRTCYKSTRKEGTTAKDFVDRMINSKHFSMLEHGAVYLKIPIYYSDDWDQSNKGKIFNKVANSPYSKIIRDSSNNFWYLSTNLRVIKENNAEFLLEYWCEPTEFHEKRITIKFVADIHFYKDTTRHRLFSWAIESTRFCNYMKEKFGMSVSFMKPTWIREEDIPELEEDCRTIESIYFKWINKGYQAQHAAYFLPQGTKAEVIMTGFQSDYSYFFDLRAKGTTGAPHPDVKALVEPVYKTFIERNYI